MSKNDTTAKKVSPYLLQPCRTYEEYLRDRERAERALEEAATEKTVVFGSSNKTIKLFKDA